MREKRQSSLGCVLLARVSLLFDVTRCMFATVMLPLRFVARDFFAVLNISRNAMAAFELRYRYGEENSVAYLELYD